MVSFIWKCQIQEVTAAFLATAIELGIGMSEGLWSSFDRLVGDKGVLGLLENPVSNIFWIC